MSNLVQAVVTRSLSDIIAQKPQATPTKTSREYTKTPSAPEVKAEEIAKLAMTVGGFHIIPSLLVPGTNKIAKFGYPYSVCGVVKIVWAKFATIEDEEERNHVMDCVDRMMSTNNTIIAVLTRLKDTMPTVSFNGKYTPSIANYIRLHFPRKIIKDVITTPDFSDGTIFDIVLASDAGFPFMLRKATRNAKCGQKEIAEEAKALALKYCDMLSKDDAFGDHATSFKTYMRNHPAEFTYILKRKFERQPRECYDKKVRPYFVAPFALKLLFKWVSYYCRMQNMKFDETVEGEYVSNSAYQFCWSSGGADRLVSWIENARVRARKEKRIVFAAICFGDDQYFVFSDGTKIVIVAPDVQAMDANVWSEVPSKEMSNHLGAFEVMPSLLYRNVCRLMAKHSTSVDVLVHGALVVHKSHGENSGACMTTQMDMHQSGIIQAVVQGLVDKANVEKKDIEWILGSMPNLVLLLTGCKIKPETLKTQVFLGPIISLNLPFLGYQVMLDPNYEKFYPVPASCDKAWASLALPSRPASKVGVMDVLLERIYGLLLSGYCFYDKFDKLANELFEYVTLQGGILKNVDATQDILGGLSSVEFITKHPHPLTQFECKQFYILGPAAIGNPLVAAHILEGGSENDRVGTVEITVGVPLIKAPIPSQDSIPLPMVGKHVGRRLKPPLTRTKHFSDLGFNPDSRSVAKNKTTRRGQIDSYDFEDYDDMSVDERSSYFDKLVEEAERMQAYMDMLQEQKHLKRGIVTRGADDSDDDEKDFSRAHGSHADFLAGVDFDAIAMENAMTGEHTSGSSIRHGQRFHISDKG
nr:MAG: RNA-dependent RNA polymerase [Permutotetraviridae sp.]